MPPLEFAPRTEYPADLRDLPDHQRHPFRPLVSLALALVWSCTWGCALEQRMAIEVIDAPLRETGTELRASRSPRDELRIGSYTITAILRRNTRDGAPLLPDLKPRPSTFYHLSFELQHTNGPKPTTSLWTSCVAERRIAQNSDFAAAADESHDEVALSCTLRDATAQTWTLRAQGDVSRGLSGALQPVDKAKPRAQEQDPPASESTFEIEVLARRRFFGAVARKLPFPVAQLRRRQGVTAAMFLDTPERAWLAKGLSSEEHALALSTMVALRLLPLGESALGR